MGELVPPPATSDGWKWIETPEGWRASAVLGEWDVVQIVVLGPDGIDRTAWFASRASWNGAAIHHGEYASAKEAFDAAVAAVSRSFALRTLVKAHDAPASES